MQSFGSHHQCSRYAPGFFLSVALLGAFAGARAGAAAVIYSDDFDRADGPLDGWTVFAGDASILDGRLTVGPTAAEHWIWAGDPAATIPPNAENVTYSFEMEFLSGGSNPVVGRHAGFAFCANEPSQRFAATFNGYFVDWIDRATDRGVRFTRVDNGRLVELVTGAPDSPAEPPLQWRIEVGDTNIRVFGDDVLLIDIEDTTYRGGFFGVWTWSGDQEVAYDELLVEGDLKPVSACFEVSPPAPTTGADVFFDGRCSLAEGGDIVSYAWDFGDGASATGETAEHIYDFSDNYTVTLTVEDGAGNTDSFSRLVAVSETLLPFADDFDRAAGPVDGWTPFAGEWMITRDGELETATAGSEHWLWAGDPPGIISGDFVAEFDLEFLAQPGDGVGRHGGFMFFAADPTIRWQTSGYFIDWIDRAADRGARFTRVDNGALVEIVRGAPNSPAEPPRRWRVEVAGPRIRVFGDNVLLIDLEDDTYREGHVGFWAYSNGQDVLFDNLVIDSSIDIDLTACFSVGDGFVLEKGPVSFDAGCSVAPDGVEITGYEWDFGDGSSGNGAAVEHVYDAAGVYTVTLTVRAGPGEATVSRDVVVSPVALSFSDDFERDDGPVEGWTVARGEWRIEAGELAAGPTAEEHWIWAGDPPAVAPADATFTFDYSFLSGGSNPDVGRHGGFQFACDRPTQRTGAGAFSGYFIDWIDRAADHGVRLTRVDRGTLVLLVPGQGLDAPEEPPLQWRVEVKGDVIRVFGDDELLVEAVDGTYRSGFFGFWTWTGDQDVRADDLTLEGEALTPCFEVAPERLVAGQPVSFDAGCSTVLGGGATITDYRWDFGDGGTATGAAVEHTYEFPDRYTVTLTVDDDQGGTRSLERIVPVAGSLLPFADCFDGEPGPVSGWTSFAGDWAVTDDGRLETMTSGAEHWLWAGDPPLLMSGDTVLEFEMEFLFDPMDGVGRHAGVMIYAEDPTIRWQTSGYTIWWIDRPNDFGIVVMRWDDGGLAALNAGTFDAVLDPPSVWRVEVEGSFIRVFGDDELFVEVEDDTYREGFLGLWAYLNSQDVIFDNIRIGSGDLPECGGGGGGQPFVRGDTNADGAVNLSDGVFVLNFLFTGGQEPVCMEAANANGDAGPTPINISDGVYVLNFLFNGGPPPPAPFPDCASLGEEVDCASFPPCP